MVSHVGQLRAGDERGDSVEGAEMTYQEFLTCKSQLGGMSGFEPLWLPEFLSPFQRALVEWAIRKGKAAIFADCGL